MGLRKELKDLSRNIGRDKYSALSEDQKSVIAFGMTPVEIVDGFRDWMKTTISNHLAERNSIKEEIEDLSSFYKEMLSKPY